MGLSHHFYKQKPIELGCVNSPEQHRASSPSFRLVRWSSVFQKRPEDSIEFLEILQHPVSGDTESLINCLQKRILFASYLPPWVVSPAAEPTHIHTPRPSTPLQQQRKLGEVFATCRGIPAPLGDSALDFCSLCILNPTLQILTSQTLKTIK